MIHTLFSFLSILAISCSGGSDFDQFFNGVNLLKHKFSKELGFDVYWANSKAKEVTVELGEGFRLLRKGTIYESRV
ncbi:hypothetical protein OOZ15_08935 [Galbibacter sp. EGI 63066]|uniref:hypothetical protein n=1 Tax=Galbibacter sp. EGI 63066 TaxID=2993559 RepID=UPI0022495F86|nr:hypothetical protein [Galbibacter sp. EGI 63066]MCX2680060.1 hypothetical protein [Galbibacter sp. EGI 63066]